jgi:hypothetical protein
MTEEIWVDLAPTPENIPSPSWHADVLRAREKRISEGTSHFQDIAEAKKAVREQRTFALRMMFFEGDY